MSRGVFDDNTQESREVEMREVEHRHILKLQRIVVDPHRVWLHHGKIRTIVLIGVWSLLSLEAGHHDLILAEVVADGAPGIWVRIGRRKSIEVAHIEITIGRARPPPVDVYSALSIHAIQHEGVAHHIGVHGIVEDRPMGLQLAIDSRHPIVVGKEDPPVYRECQ